MKTIHAAIMIVAAFGIGAASASAAPLKANAEASVAAPGVPATAAQALRDNPRLGARIQPFLPNGQKIEDAAKGFTDVLTFLATVHAAHNQAVPFATLKSQVLGTPPTTLPRALLNVAPRLGQTVAQSAASFALREAQNDIAASHRPVTPSGVVSGS